MSRLQDVYNDLNTKKQERRELQKMFKDELAASSRYQEILEKAKKLRLEKKAIENDIKSHALKDAQRLDDLRHDIQSDQELLADIALNMYLSKQPVEITDEKNNRWVPYFKVTFKKD